MLKRLLTLCALASVCSSAVFAGNLYLGPSLFVQDNTDPTSNYRGVHPRLSVGYADTYEGFHWAGEVFAVPFSATLADNHSNGATSARSTRSYGASFLPGMMMTDSILAYLRAGVVSTQFSGPNTSRAGGQIGLGLQTCLSTYWDFRAEYIYTAYKTVPIIGAVKSDQVGIGLVYKVLG